MHTRHRVHGEETQTGELPRQRRHAAERSQRGIDRDDVAHVEGQRRDRVGPHEVGAERARATARGREEAGDGAVVGEAERDARGRRGARRIVDAGHVVHARGEAERREGEAEERRAVDVHGVLPHHLRARRRRGSPALEANATWPPSALSAASNAVGVRRAAAAGARERVRAGEQIRDDDLPMRAVRAGREVGRAAGVGDVQARPRRCGLVGGVVAAERRSSLTRAVVCGAVAFSGVRKNTSPCEIASWLPSIARRGSRSCRRARPGSAAPRPSRRGPPDRRLLAVAVQVRVAPRAPRTRGRRPRRRPPPPRAPAETPPSARWPAPSPSSARRAGRSRRAADRSASVSVFRSPSSSSLTPTATVCSSKRSETSGEALSNFTMTGFGNCTGAALPPGAVTPRRKSWKSSGIDDVRVESGSLGRTWSVERCTSAVETAPCGEPTDGTRRWIAGSGRNEIGERAHEAAVRDLVDLGPGGASSRSRPPPSRRRACSAGISRLPFPAIAAGRAGFARRLRHAWSTL